MNEQNQISLPCGGAVPLPNFIGGEWVHSDGATAEVIDPSTGETIAVTAQSTAADVGKAVEAARAAFEAASWRRLPPSERTNLLWRLSELIDRERDPLVRLECANMGMPVDHAKHFMIDGVIATLRYYAGWATKLEGRTVTLGLPDGREEGAMGSPFHAYSQKEPIGVVAAIVPWNVPLIMAIAKIAPAITAGCTVILKPALETPLTALRLAELSIEAGFPPGVINVVTGGAEAGSALAEHHGVDKVAFTGSLPTARKIAQAALGNMKRVSFELGGKSPFIILADSDLDSAIAHAAHGIMMNTGQICFIGTRLLIEAPVFDRVIEGIAGIMSETKIGGAFEPGMDMGPLISARQKERVMGFLDGASKEGASIVHGGRAIERAGFFVEPALAVVDDNASTIYREEVFGPVLTARKGADPAELVAMANDTPYGLAASLWTRDVSRAHTMADALETGVVWVNCQGELDESIPFGGMKQSGWGREGSLEGVEEYLESKGVVIAL